MATLTRYSDFKSLKHTTTPKVKKVSNAKAKQLQEIEIFINLIQKKKQKTK